MKPKLLKAFKENIGQEWENLSTEVLAELVIINGGDQSLNKHF